jgi:hypothetical protein
MGHLSREVAHALSSRTATHQTVEITDKPALAYLEASGARAISITTGNGHVVLGVGYRADAIAAFWLRADKARAVAARARSIGGVSANMDGADAAGTIAALKQAAVQLGVTLTAHDVAMARASVVAERLDVLMDQLKVSGIWLDFTKTYRQRWLAAKAPGEGFMPFAAAELRFQRALIPLLQSGGKPTIGQSLFATIFD